MNQAHKRAQGEKWPFCFVFPSIETGYYGELLVNLYGASNRREKHSTTTDCPDRTYQSNWRRRRRQTATVGPIRPGVLLLWMCSSGKKGSGKCEWPRREDEWNLGMGNVSELGLEAKSEGEGRFV